MLRNLSILALTIALGLSLTLFLDHNAPEKAIAGYVYEQGKTVPAFSFTDNKGRNHNISDFKGKIVVLNFWASWCAPCVKEMPLFLDLALEFSDKVVFIGLSSDFTQDSMGRFLDRIRQQKPEEMLLDNVIFAFDQNGEITREIFQTYRLPETIIIDAGGLMQSKFIGADWDYTDLKKITAAL